MAEDSSNAGQNGKASKLPNGFPLFRHDSGRWCKKVKGRFCYFGKVSDDPKGDRAIRLWLEQKDSLLAGRKPREVSAGVTVEALGFAFLDSKQRLVETGELSPRSLENYRQVCKRLAEILGRHRAVADLNADDFRDMRSTMANGVGVVTLRNIVRQTRMVFKYGFDAGLIEKPVRFGADFKIPAKRHVKRERRLAGKRMFAADELRAMIEAAPQPLRSMLLLAINTGCGNTDCSELQQSDINLKTGWMDYPRRKTETDRRAKLWPETVSAITEAVKLRPRASTAIDEGCVFLTKFGQRFVRIGEGGGPIDAVAAEFTKLVKSPRCPKCGTVNRVGREKTVASCRGCKWEPEDGEEWGAIGRHGFYAIRHTFQTIADESKDFPAVRQIMGHADASMSAEYRENISNERLEAVADLVHRWLWPEVSKPAKPRRK